MKRIVILLLLVILSHTLSAQIAMLRISEILYEPATGVAEFIEVYNAGGSNISLADLYIARLKDDSVTSLYQASDDYSISFSPQKYYVLTTDAASIMSTYNVRYPLQIIELASMPPLRNGSGTVMLCTADTIVIDRLDYSDAMHQPMMRSHRGVSLERCSMSASTNDASNWSSASATAGYATPTYANSQNIDETFIDDDFHFSSTTISPDADGYQDALTIDYTLQDADLLCNMQVLDARGRLVRHLLRGSTLGTNGSITWDGCDSNGTPCPRGNYIVYAELYNQRGLQKTMKRSVAVVY